MQKTRPRSVRFNEVEVIELAIVAGENHPCQRGNIIKQNGINGENDDTSKVEGLDSAAIALGWEAQARTKMDLESYEEKQRKLQMGTKLKRMSRAVRKRILRNIGVETSDIESEDERIARKKVGRRMQKKKKRSNKKNTVNPFSTSNSSPASTLPDDRFSSGGNELHSGRSDNLPQLPHRGGDNGLGLPPHRGLSPARIRDSIGFTNGPERRSPPSTSPQGNYRRLSLDNLASAVGVLAKQPVKLVKQPVRLAKYTTEKVRKGVGRVRRSLDSLDDDLEPTHGLPRSPPVYVPSTLSSDDEDLPTCDIDDSFRNNPLPVLPPNHNDGSYREGRSSFVVDECISVSHIPGSSPTDSKRSRRSSFSQVTNAIGVMAMQPVRMAKERVRLANYRPRTARRRKVPSRNSKSSDEDSLNGVEPSLSTLPPPLSPAHLVYGLQDSSDDDISFTGPSSSLASRRIPENHTGAESGDDEIENSEAFEVQAGVQGSSTRVRRSSFQHVTKAIGAVALQPYKLAKYTVKQPIKLAKYTGNSIRQRMNVKRQGDDNMSVESDLLSEDDTPRYLEGSHGSIQPLEGSVTNERQISVSPRQLLSPIIDGSEHNSSADLSKTRDSNLPLTALGMNSINHSDSMIFDSDLDDGIEDEFADASEDEDIVVEDDLVQTNDVAEDVNRAISCQIEETGPSVPPRRVTMTGVVACCSDALSFDDPLQDIVADIAKEDMLLLESWPSTLIASRLFEPNCADGSSVALQYVPAENKFVATAKMGPNPQDMHEMLPGPEPIKNFISEGASH